MIQDSGARRKFESGAVRDIADGKGRCDLLPLDVVGDMLEDPILIGIDRFLRTGEEGELYSVISKFCDSQNWHICTALLEVSKHFEDGAKKYSENNWKLGIPLHCYIDSAIRHYLKFRRKDEDEHHDRAFIWNCLCALWTLSNKPELNDLPFKKENTNDQ